MTTIASKALKGWASAEKRHSKSCAAPLAASTKRFGRPGEARCKAVTVGLRMAYEIIGLVAREEVEQLGGRGVFVHISASEVSELEGVSVELLCGVWLALQAPPGNVEWIVTNEETHVRELAVLVVDIHVGRAL